MISSMPAKSSKMLRSDQQMKTKTIVSLVAGALLLVGATAGASVYLVENMAEKQPVTISAAPVSAPGTVTFSPPPSSATLQPVCDDGNIVGKVVGGAAGGIAGSQFGGGTGKTAATIGGAVGGVLLGEEFIPTQNVTCR